MLLPKSAIVDLRQVSLGISGMHRTVLYVRCNGVTPLNIPLVFQTNYHSIIGVQGYKHFA